MRNLKNVEIREALKEKGIYQYELADKMGISEFTLVKRFRKEQAPKEKEQIIMLINEIAKEREGEQ